MNEQKKPQEDNFTSGPFSLLTRACKTNAQVLIALRNNRKLISRLKAFDRHMNMVLQNATEYWTQIPKKGKKGGVVNRERIVPKMFVRGDSIIYVIYNPK